MKPCPGCGAALERRFEDRERTYLSCLACNGWVEVDAQGRVTWHQDQQETTVDQTTNAAAEAVEQDPNELVGRKALLQPATQPESAAGMLFRVEIIGTRKHFGRTDVLVRPCDGNDATAWVSAFDADGQPMPRLTLEPAA